MPTNTNSTLRKRRKTLHGWKDGDKFCLSLEPKGLVCNVYASAVEALAEASRRHLPITWEDPSKL